MFEGCWLDFDIYTPVPGLMTDEVTPIQEIKEGFGY